jgi:hypothetical protein
MYWMGLEHLFDVAHKSGDFDGSPSANRMVFEKAELVGLRTVDAILPKPQSGLTACHTRLGTWCSMRTDGVLSVTLLQAPKRDTKRFALSIVRDPSVAKK